MTDKIIIKNTKDADGRTAGDDLTKERLYEATEIHVNDVLRVMDWFGKQLHEIGLKHDYTKLGANFEEYSEVVLKGLSEEEFEQTNWCQRHYFEERHHVNDQAWPDVNLLDILEHIADIVTAGKGRAGHVASKYCDINPILLYRAYWNTIRLLDDIIVVSNAEELDSKTARATVHGENLDYDKSKEEGFLKTNLKRNDYIW